jgi:uncharacterized membrane protein YedE/YeeE
MAILGGYLLFYGWRNGYDLVYFALFIKIMKNIKFLIIGMLFGIILVKSQMISWFRIQEMFRLQGFHMYGVIGSAVIVGIISIQFLKRLRLKTIHGEKIVIQEKIFHWGNVYGGLIFGLGWAITGACPGPLYAQVGSGFLVTIVTLLSAVAGTWTYGVIRNKLPH